jgi:3-hydroxy-9,10-secoandrosta-1,3,5(10)-triene-9,17-dione monooxygenase
VSSGAIGALQGAIDAYREIAGKRIGTNTGTRTAEDPHAQMAVARAQSVHDQLNLKLHAHFERLMTDARPGEATDINLRVQYRYESAAVPEECLNQVLELQKMCGGRAIFLDSPLQRFVLDILAGRAHVANNPYAYGKNFGGIQLGLENADIFL